MNEIITVNGVAYTVQNVTTGANSISFVLTNLTIEEAETAFKSAESLTVGTEEETVYAVEVPEIGELTVCGKVEELSSESVQELLTLQKKSL